MEVFLARPSNQNVLLKAFRESLGHERKRSIIADVSKFKFSLYRLKPRRDVLRRIAPFRRPTRPFLGVVQLHSAIRVRPSRLLIFCCRRFNKILHMMPQRPTTSMP